jgi:hypothetical protein
MSEGLDKIKSVNTGNTEKTHRGSQRQRFPVQGFSFSEFSLWFSIVLWVLCVEAFCILPLVSRAP